MPLTRPNAALTRQQGEILLSDFQNCRTSQRDQNQGQQIHRRFENELAALGAAHSFRLEYSESLTLPECPEEGALAASLCHRSGVRIYLVACESQESAFSYCFATPPQNDKGLAHIIEHTVFCGSRNYPLKEPFANLQKTSVCSFLNAMTYPEQTLYPAASSFAPDFLQLFKVYGDAVFFPLLEDQAFAQEGLRQAAQGLEGIVFNEMRGYYGDFDAYVADSSLRGLFPPGHPNSFDAGGDPRAIAQIDCRDYQELREFHRSHYRPQNCRIVMYGSIPRRHLTEILKYLDGELLSSFGDSAADIIQECPNWELPRRQKLYQAVPVEAAGERRRSVVLSWLLPPQCCARSSVEYRLLEELLLGNSGAVWELPIMRSGWGAELSLGSGLEFDLHDAVLRVGLSAYQPRDARDFHNLVLNALHEFCDRAEQLKKRFGKRPGEQPGVSSIPINSDENSHVNSDVNSKGVEASGIKVELKLLWEGALNSLEYEDYSLGESGGEDGICALERCLQLARASLFYVRGAASRSRPSAVSVCAQTARLREVFAALQPSAVVASLRREGLAAFAAKVRGWTLDNPHWTLQLFEGVTAADGEQEIAVPLDLQLDAGRLAQRQKAFTAYQRRRDTLEQSARIVAMGRDEFDESPPLVEAEHYYLDGDVEFFCSRQNAKASLIILDFYWEISDWKEERLRLLPLLLDLLDDMGLPGIGYAEVAKQKSLTIGSCEMGISLQRLFRAEAPPAGHADSEPDVAPLRSFVHVQLSFLPTEWRRGLALFWRLLSSCDWGDHRRLRELLQSLYYDRTQELCSNPLEYCARRSFYRLSRNSAVPLTQSARLQAQLDEYFYGLEQVELLVQICRQQDALPANFTGLQQALLQAPLSCAISAPVCEQGALRSSICEALAAARAVVPPNSQPHRDLPAGFALSPPVDLNAADLELWQGGIALEHLCIALPAPYWNYTGASPKVSATNPALELLVKLLQSGSAWEKIRLQQGAYGVRVRQQSGFLSLSSSQDPDALHSMELFRQAIVGLREQAAEPSEEFGREFEAALVQALAARLKVPLISQHARIALIQAKTGLGHEDSRKWLQRLRELQPLDLVPIADFLLEQWPQRSNCIFAAGGRINTKRCGEYGLNLQARQLTRYK